MRTTLNLQKEDPKLYLPEPAKIIKIEQFTEHEKFFQLELLNRKTLGSMPGQFVQLSIMGYGEAPISISSPPRNDNKFELCVRAVGDVTNKLHTLKVGDILHIRGPFGHGFTDEILASMKGKHLLFVAGGIGYVPMRSLVNKVIPEHDQYKKVSVLYGCKTPKDRMFTQELDGISKMGGNVELLETVDCADERWTCGIGVITTLIPKVTFNPQETIAVIVGPPIMYKFVLRELLARDIPHKNIYMSLERRMKCGIGKCGHCQMEGIYVCQEGPVFNYADIDANEEAI